MADSRSDAPGSPGGRAGEPIGVDVAVIGAGPAGLAAAVAAAGRGANVALLDLGPAPGGQYWRHPPADPADPGKGLYHRWPTFRRLAAAVDAYRAAGRCRYLPEHAVWSMTGRGPFTVCATAGERERAPVTVRAAAVVVATGAYDRPLPFPGWDLPGVMSAGAAQALVKGSRQLPGRRVLVAGTGPFLLPVAAGLLALGADVLGVAEANDPFGYLRHPGRTAAAWRKWPEAAGYARRLARCRVPLWRRRAVVEAVGDDRLRAVRIAPLDADWAPAGAESRVVETDVLAVGYGFVPNIDLLTAAGCESRRDAHGSLVAVVSENQQTSVPGIFAAGETTGVGGADLALIEGEIAGRAAAGRGERLPPRSSLARSRQRLRRFAGLLDAVHPVGAAWPGWLTEDTTICRCEEVTVAAMRERLADLDDADPRTVKLLTRAGMGWCQGRMCAPAVRTLHGQPAAGAPAAVERRPLAQPVTLAALAALDTETGQAGEPRTEPPLDSAG